MSESPGVRIDISHADLLYGLVRAQKPRSVLEFGFGGGRSAEAILRGLRVNGGAFDYALIENWCDWFGLIPDEARAFLLEHREIDLIVCAESEFILPGPTATTLAYDFILSDADHQNTHRWFKRVYDRLLAPGGILLYHDVCNADYPGLCGLPEECRRRGISHVVFQRSSSAEERCERGLLVIFKGPQE